MADSLRNLNRGEPLRRITAGHIAGWNEAARAVAAASEDRPFDLEFAGKQAVVMKALNDSGVDLDEFSVTRVSAPCTSYDEDPDEFRYNTALKLGSPGNASDQDTIAVLLQPLKANEIGRAVIMGAVPVKVYVDTGQSAWKWADVTSGVTAHLVATQYGGCAKIIWKQSGTGGEKWALVCLLGLEAAAAGYSGTITDYRYTCSGGSLIETARSITVVNGVITAVGTFA